MVDENVPDLNEYINRLEKEKAELLIENIQLCYIGSFLCVAIEEHQNAVLKKDVELAKIIYAMPTNVSIMTQKQRFTEVLTMSKYYTPIDKTMK